MPNTIRQHDYIDGVCQHCRDRQSDNTGINTERACIAREVTRPVPESVFSDLTTIGERMRVSRGEEDAARAGTPEPAQGI